MQNTFVKANLKPSFCTRGTYQQIELSSIDITPLNSHVSDVKTDLSQINGSSNVPLFSVG